jgi:hypothetical protein
MRFVLLTAAFLTAASMLFNGYANGRGNLDDRLSGTAARQAVDDVIEVGMVIENDTRAHRDELEKQIR